MMETQEPTLLVRADACPNVGSRHVMRTLALAQAWKRRGGIAKFVCGELPRSLIKRIDAEQFQLFQTKHDKCDGADAQDTAEIASIVKPDWIVLDGSRFDAPYQRAISSTGSKLLVIDDHGNSDHPSADLILRQNIPAYLGRFSDSCRGKILAGPQFVLLQNEFGHQQRNALDSKRIASEARRILVMFGGADPDNWTLKSLQVLSDLKRKRLVVDCVVSACYAHTAELEMFKKTANMYLRIHRNVDRISHLISRIDLAITAVGPTSYELAHLGVPAIVASLAENQHSNATALNERGIMVSIDDSSPSTESLSSGRCLNDARLQQAIRSLILDPQRRKSMSELGRRLVDGNGARRIARTMIADTFSIRLAAMEDVNIMWHWQNDPEVRSVSLDNKPIQFSAFSRLLQKQLDRPQTQIWIAEDSQGQPIGQIRFETDDAGQPPVISILVDQTKRGRGLGTLMISRGCEEFFNTSNAGAVMAQIKPGNVASEKAFRAAGFLGIEPAIINGKMAAQFLLDRRQGENATGAPVERKKSA